MGRVHYCGNMQPMHNRLASIFCVLSILAQPVFAAPQRIVSTNLCTDEYVFRLVPRNHIAALSFEATDRHPVVSTIADVARGMATIHPSGETVLALKPDLVVMYQGTMPLLRNDLKRLGVALLDVPWANSLADIRTITIMLGRKLGAPDKAEAMLAEMDRKIAAARARAPHPPVRAILYAPNGYAETDAVSEEIMALSGVVDAAPAGQLTRRGTLPLEALIAAAPELLILGSDVGGSRAEAILHHPALRALAGRTTIVRASLLPLSCPGPWSLDAAKTFGDLARKSRVLAKRRLSN
jgi:iron complex transport system substrate-binding protein